MKYKPDSSGSGRSLFNVKEKLCITQEYENYSAISNTVDTKLRRVSLLISHRI